ncbi:MAG: hypothetical protein ACR2JF_17350 [Iamia sp.]
MSCTPIANDELIRLNPDGAAALRRLVRSGLDHVEARIATGEDPFLGQLQMDRALLRSMGRQLTGHPDRPWTPLGRLLPSLAPTTAPGPTSSPQLPPRLPPATCAAATQ